MNSKEEQVFKTCPMCETTWESRDTFLDDPELVFNGYQANFGNIEEGLFYFTHETTSCGSTLVIRTRAFLSLYSGTRYTGVKQFTEECPGYCHDRNQLQRCQAPCEYAFVREVSQIIRDRSHNSVGLSPSPP